jgi:AcrR family transcriptional regulator
LPRTSKGTKRPPEAGSQNLPRPGRPRDPRLDNALLNAARVEMSRHGFHGASLAAIARRAGVSTPAIYRRWPTKTAMAIDLLARDTQPASPPGAQSLRDDLIEYLRTWQGRWWTTLFHRVVLPASAEAGTNARMAAQLRSAALAYRQPLEERIRRAVAAGELRPDTDPQRLLDLLGGSVAIPLLFHLDVPGAGEVGAIVDRVLDGFAGVERRPRSSPRKR